MGHADVKKTRGTLFDVAAVAVAACAAGIMNDFTNDDIPLIVTNERMHSLSNWREWLTAAYWPPPYSPDLYRPLTSALLAFEYVLGGGSPIVYRFVSYLLYAAVCVMVYQLCTRIMPQRFAVAAAVLFAAHPVHVEATALAVGQSELIVALCALAMTTLYIDRRRGGGIGTRDCVTFALLYLAACLAKEQGLVIPFILLAAEATFCVGSMRERLRAMRALACLPLVALLVVVLRNDALGAITGTFTAEALDGVSAGGRVLTMLAIVPQWFRLLLFPLHLRADYSPAEFLASSTLGFAEGLGLVLLVAAVVLAWTMRRRIPAVTFGIVWCAIALGPVSNVVVVTGVLLAERTMFLPSIGFVIALMGGAAYVVQRWEVDVNRRLNIAFATVVMLLIARSIERQRVWQNEPVLVSRSVADAPRSFRMQRAFGDILFDLKQEPAARDAYDRALRYSPERTRWRVRNNYAYALERSGHWTDAIQQLLLSLAQRPDQDYARGELIVSYLAAGEYRAAATQTDTAIARGGNLSVYSALRSMADSAARVGAPAGSVKVGLERGNVRADR